MPKRAATTPKARSRRGRQPSARLSRLPARLSWTWPSSQRRLTAGLACWGSTAHGERVGRRVGPAVGDGKQDLGNMQHLGLVLGPAAQKDLRPARWLATDFHVGPAKAPAPGGAQALEDGFLGCPTSGKILRGMLATLTEADFPVGVDPRQEQFAMALDHPADAQAFHDVGADANDFHDGTAFLVPTMSPADLSKPPRGRYNPERERFPRALS